MTEAKMATTVVLVVGSAFWGRFAWLLLLWLGCLLLDYITGSLAAISRGEWSSKAARHGIWHKLGAVIAVMVAMGADLLVAMTTECVPGFELSYHALLTPMVLMWYILTELGSIMENAVRMGAPVPEFLKKGLELMKDRKR